MTPEILKVKATDIVENGLWRLYPVINVDKVKDIPSDYPGLMGVPITFMDKYNPEAFEILACPNHLKIEGRETYRRLIIRNLHPVLPEEVDLQADMRRVGLPAIDIFMTREKETATT